MSTTGLHRRSKPQVARTTYIDIIEPSPGSSDRIVLRSILAAACWHPTKFSGSDGPFIALDSFGTVAKSATDIGDTRASRVLETSPEHQSPKESND